MKSISCPVEGCTKDVKRGNYCYAHYMKNWRYGTPTPDHAPRWEDLSGQRFGALLVTTDRDGQRWVCQCDCGRTATRRTGDLKRYGDSNTCGTEGAHYRTSSPVYTASHYRVRKQRGDATDYTCVDCDVRASHWSYDHEDPDEMQGIVGGYLVAYSPNPKHYSPRCVPCHKRFDLDNKLANRIM